MQSTILHSLHCTTEKYEWTTIKAEPSAVQQHRRANSIYIIVISCFVGQSTTSCPTYYWIKELRMAIKWWTWGAQRKSFHNFYANNEKWEFNLRLGPVRHSTANLLLLACFVKEDHLFNFGFKLNAASFSEKNKWRPFVALIEPYSAGCGTTLNDSTALHVWAHW